MEGTFYHTGEIMINDQNYESLQFTDDIFKAYVDAIIPRSPGLAEEYGKVQYYGALDLYTDEYLILSLNNYYFPIAEPTAEMLETAAEQLILSEGTEVRNASEFPGPSTYGELPPIDRLRALTLLEQFLVNVANLPIPFQDNPSFVLYITSILDRFTLMGYYSEWSGYASTRLEAPNQRKLEYFPLSWEQVGYPGPSLGYRALRVNYSQ